MTTDMLARWVAKRAESRFNRAFRGPTTVSDRSRGRWSVACYPNYPIHCTAVVRPGDIIVFDDPACGTACRPPLFATASLPDPSRAAAKTDPAQFREVLCVGHNRVFEKIA